MDSDRCRVESAISYVFGGLHNAPKMNEINSFRYTVSVNTFQDFSTFDSDRLTRVVIAAHMYCVRISANSSGPNMVKYTFWARDQQSEDFSERHPTRKDLAERCLRISADAQTGEEVT